MKNVYALLVGLNNYKERIRPLKACVPDIKQFENYLLTTQNVPKENIVTLIDSAATKTSIVDNFRNHLSKATSDDVALFYFGGHGVRQIANPAFGASAMNGRIECITCFDTNFAGENLIADKELRWLIHELEQNTGGCHIVTIFDSCHSGDNTRAIGDPDSEPIVRMMVDERGSDKPLPMRKWADFIFSDKVTEQMVIDALKDGSNQFLDGILPQGRHIQLAACSSIETAKETPTDSIEKYGYFSRNLLELLKATGGKVTYYDLRSLIYQKLNRLPDEKSRQAPQFYTYSSSIFQRFLGGAAEQEEIQATVYYNKAESRWEMDMGSIYGIPSSTASNLVQLFVNLDDEGTQTEVATVKEVFHDYSVLRFENEENRKIKEGTDFKPRLDESLPYKTYVKKFMQKTVNVACDAVDFKAAWQLFCSTNPHLLEAVAVKWTDKNADFSLNTEGGTLFLTLPNEPQKPIAETFSTKSEDKIALAFESILKQLGWISRWSFLKSHNNPDYKGGGIFDSLEISFNETPIQDGGKQAIDGKNAYIHEGRYWSKQVFSIKLKNNHPTQTFHVAVAWLSELFGIDTLALNGSAESTPLEPNQTAYIYGEGMAVSFNPYIIDDGWKKFTNYAKIYVSTKFFGITHFQQTDLNPPEKSKRGGGAPPNTRAGGAPPVAQRLPEWMVKTIEFEVVL